MAQFRQSHERKNPNLQNFVSSKSLLVCCLHVVPGTYNPGTWFPSEEPQSKPLFPISNYATISGSWVITETRGLSHSSAYSLNSFCQSSSSSSSSSSSPWVLLSSTTLLKCFESIKSLNLAITPGVKDYYSSHFPEWKTEAQSN